MDEFGLIRKYLSPLAGKGSFRLRDDAAVAEGGVVTKDVLVEGVHFRAEDPLDLVAQKALRVNVSDLIAKGCVPRDYFLGLVWSRGTGEADIAKFSQGLAADQDEFGLSLLGGDTTRAFEGGGLIISVTMIGNPWNKSPVLRSGARPGDVLMVTGVIGQSGLGLAALSKGGTVEPGLARAYQLPDPPVGMASAIAQYTHAALDISDGVVADAMHLADASGVAVQIDADQVPLSDAGKALAATKDGLEFLLSCGDDYQPLMAVPPEAVAEMQKAADATGVNLSVIGEICEGEGVAVRSARFGALDIERAGYKHF